MTPDQLNEIEARAKAVPADEDELAIRLLANDVLALVRELEDTGRLEILRGLRDRAEKAEARVKELEAKIPDLEARCLAGTEVDESLKKLYFDKYLESEARVAVLREALQFYADHCSGPEIPHDWRRTPTYEVARKALGDEM